MCTRSVMYSFNAYIEKCKEKWRQKSPKQKWLFVHNIGAKCGEVSGCRVYTDARVYWLSYLSLVIAFIHFPTVFYTLWIYHKKGEFLVGMQCTCTLGGLYMIYTMYFNSIGGDRFRTCKILNHAGKYMYTDDKEPSEYNKMCEEMIVELLNHVIVVASLMTSSFLVMSPFYIHAYLSGNVRVTLLATELPFIDINTDVGYTINIAQQSFFLAVACIGSVCIEIGASIACNTINMWPRFVNLESKRLEKELNESGMSVQVEKQMRDIFLHIENLNGYSQELIDTYYMRMFLGPFILTATMSFCIFTQLILGNPIGYGMAFYNYAVIFISCFMGEQMRAANLRMTAELFNLPWYSLSSSCQKGVCAAMHWMQNGPQFTMGPFGELTFETASDLSKVIYKFTMMLFKIFN